MIARQLMALAGNLEHHCLGRRMHDVLARAEVAREVLPDGLRARGWQVDVVDA